MSPAYASKRWGRSGRTFTAVHRAAFDGSTFTDERRHAMAAGLPFADARCLLAYDDRGNAVAAVRAVRESDDQAREAG